jgi:hypothetical protein
VRRVQLHELQTGDVFVGPASCVLVHSDLYKDGSALLWYETGNEDMNKRKTVYTVFCTGENINRTGYPDDKGFWSHVRSEHLWGAGVHLYQWHELPY